MAVAHAGKLEGVTGIVFGEMLECASPGMPAEFLEQVQSLTSSTISTGPIAIGLRSGHVSRQNVTLVFGIDAESGFARREAQLSGLTAVQS